jgi:hypothetical protein
MRSLDQDQTSLTETLMHLITGYQVSQVLYVAVRAGIVDALRDGSKSSADLAIATRTHAPSVHRLLRTLTAYGVLDEVASDRFALTDMGQYLRSDASEMIGSLVLMYGCDNFWKTWGELLHTVRTGETAVKYLFGSPDVFEYYAQNPEIEHIVNAGMTALSASFASAVVARVDLSAFGSCVDVGGGRGFLLSAILRTYPTMRGILFDLPHVVAAAAPLLEKAGVTAQSDIVAGDMFSCVPHGAELYLLSRVIHDWGDEHALDILTVCHRAMGPEAKLMLIERVLATVTDRSGLNQRRLLSDLNMLVRTGGRERTVDEYSMLLKTAGFQVDGVIPTITEVTIIEASRL